MSTRTKFVYVFRIKVRKQGPKFIFKVTLREQCAIRVCSCREAIKHPNALGLQSIEEFTQGRVLTTHKRQTLERDMREIKRVHKFGFHGRSFVLCVGCQCPTLRATGMPVWIGDQTSSSQLNTSSEQGRTCAYCQKLAGVRETASFSGPRRR